MPTNSGSPASVICDFAGMTCCRSSARTSATVRTARRKWSGSKWPKRTKNLPDALKREFARLLALKRAIGARSLAGEIATVLMATHRGADLVLIDDDWGSDFAAKTNGLTVMSTARLTPEMVAAGALSDNEGFAVFDGATPGHVGRERYETGLQRLRR